MSKIPKDSIYSDEKQARFLRDERTGLPYVSEKAYDLDRSSPLDTLRHMIREYYTPDVLSDNKVASAIVLRVESKIFPTSMNVVQQSEWIAKTQVVRVRVLTDKRNFWIPVPKSYEDPVISMYPLVVNNIDENKELKEGDIVEVLFYNDKAQFSTISDVGRVSSIMSRAEMPVEIPPLSPLTLSNTPLPPRPSTNYSDIISGALSRAAEFLQTSSLGGPQMSMERDTTVGKKGQELVNDKMFNDAVAAMAKRLRLKKQHLLDIMEFESTINPQAVNPKTNATGLIQFMPETATKLLNTTVKHLRTLSGLQQLKFVEEYYVKQGKGNLNLARKDGTLGAIYLLVIYPAAIKMPNDYVIGNRREPGKTHIPYGVSKKKLKKYPKRYWDPVDGTRITSYPRLFAVQNSPFGKKHVKNGVVKKSDILSSMQGKIDKFVRLGVKIRDPYA